MTDAASDTGLGLRHAHVWTTLTHVPRLQAAHDRLRWDVSKSRILSVNVCTVCDELPRDSIADCAVADCHEHKICERPYR